MLRDEMAVQVVVQAALRAIPVLVLAVQETPHPYPQAKVITAVQT
jgi:hypothetical protein